MEIDLTPNAQERLKMLLAEKALIEQRINDIIYTICDYENVDVDVQVTINKEITKLIING
jgi:septum formation topological specificity factor MinE